MRPSDAAEGGDTAPPNRRARGPRTRLLAAAALAVALVTGLGTYALWSDSQVAGGSLLRAGDLDLVLAGPPTWTETSPDVANAPRGIDPESFRAMPGDTVELRQDVVTTLSGDNIAGELSVHWSSPEELPDGVSATYQLHDGDGAAMTPAPVAVGDSWVMPELPAGESSWSVTVRFVLDPDPAYAEGDAVAGAPAPLADLGEMVIDLRQVRSGDGSAS